MQLGFSYAMPRSTTLLLQQRGQFVLGLDRLYFDESEALHASSLVSMRAAI